VEFGTNWNAVHWEVFAIYYNRSNIGMYKKTLCADVGAAIKCPMCSLRKLETGPQRKTVLEIFAVYWLCKVCKYM
jgi:hypothetical protein